jgi:N-acetylglutamate synthase-like GNAT family acetyltransferase
MPDKLVKSVIVPFGSANYHRSVALRDRILRKPLGMVFTPEQLSEEKDQVHICGFEDDKMIACLILKKNDPHTCQMRQVAVDENYQHKGYGKRLVLFSEQVAINHGFKKVFCHARDIAVPFYLSIGYKVIGDMFYEIGIKHYYMEKVLAV